MRFRILLRCALGLCVALGTGFAPEAVAQELRGDIVGTAQDASGGVLPGVRVTVAGPSLILPQTVTSGARGEYRFSSLPTGTYSVTFELSGFKAVRVEGIVLTLRKVLKVDGTLAAGAFSEEVDVVAHGAALDVATTSIGTSFSSDVMGTIPTGRDIWSAIGLAAGFQMAGLDVGGSTIGGQTGFSAYGNDQQHRALIEGVIMGDARSSSSGYFDFGSFGEFELGASGAMGEVAGPGAILNFSVKSGGNSFHGSGLFNYQNDAMRSDNVPQALRAGGAVDENGYKAPPGGTTIGNAITRTYDANFDVGGPILKKKAWFYVGAREQNVWRTAPGVPDFEAQTRLRNASTKINYAINAKNTLVGFLNLREKYDPNSRSALISAEASINQVGRARTFKVEWTSVLSDRLFLDVMVGHYWAINRYRSQLMDFQEVTSKAVPPGRLEITTGVLSGVGSTRTPVRSRPQFNASLVYSPGSHSLKGGIQNNRLSDIEERFSTNNTFYRDERGVPVEVEIWNTPVKSDNLNRSIGFYVQDSWRLGRVTLNPSLRYDTNKLGWADESYTPIQSAFYPPVTEPAKTVTNWHTFAPRLGVAWDIGGNGNTVLKAYAGRAYIDVAATLTVAANPVAAAARTYEFRDLNGNRVLDPGELGRFLSSGTGGTGEGGQRGGGRIDPNIKAPYGDELSVHFERELFNTASLRLSYVYKNLRNQDAEVDLLRVGAYTVPFTFRDVGPDNVSGTADDQTLNLFDRTPGVPEDRFTTNPGPAVGTPAYNSDFHTLELGFTRRMRNRWMLSAFGGHLWSTKFHDVQTGTGVNNLVRTAAAFLSNPNQRRFGRLTETTWNGKVIGRYEAPWGVSASTTLRLNSGYNWARRITVNLPQAGRVNMPAEPLTANRGQTTKILDVRVDKSINIGNTKLIAIVDVFNVLNANTVTNFQTISGANFKQVLALLPPRALRLAFDFRF